jgi:hypothetical protein
MSDTVANAQASIPLSQMERVIDTFVAPSKTFHDILRSASWWLPWLLGMLVTLGFSAAIQQQIGWDKTYSNILQHGSETQQQRLAQLPADQQAKQKAIVFAGLDADAFNLKNPVGTNLGYYLPADGPQWLIAFGTSIDVLSIWVLVLLIIGCAVVARTKLAATATAVVGWWVLITLAKVGIAAIS